MKVEKSSVVKISSVEQVLFITADGRRSATHQWILFRLQNRTGNSEAEVTNTKRLRYRYRYCWSLPAPSDLLLGAGYKYSYLLTYTPEASRGLSATAVLLFYCLQMPTWQTASSFDLFAKATVQLADTDAFTPLRENIFNHMMNVWW